MTDATHPARDGLVVGLIAYASVAVFYGIFDFFAARGPLYTVDLLGKAVFRGLRDPGVLEYPIPPDATAIFLYNGLHLVLALLIGLVVLQLIARAERHPSQSLVVLVAIATGFVATIFAVGALTTSLRPVLPWWSIVLANGLATLAAGSYLLVRRPGLWGRLTAFVA